MTTLFRPASRLAVAVGLILTPASAMAVTITVDGTSNIFAAGLSSIPSAPGGAGTLPPSITVVVGSTINITATGTVDPSGGYGPHGPDGFALASNITNATGSVISNFSSSTSAALLGVFTGSGAGLNTPFIIGSSRNVVVPIGATRLYFGLADSFSFQGQSSYYGDNSGSFVVTANAAAVPEPVAWALVVSGFGIIGSTMRSVRKTSISVRYA